MARTASRDPNAVPISVLRPIIEEWLTRHRTERQIDGQGDGYTKKDNNRDGIYSILAFQTGVNARVLRGFLGAKTTTGTNQTHVPFDTADKIVTAVLGPLAWHVDDRLTPYYGPLTVLYNEFVEGRELPDGFRFEDLPKQLGPKYRHVWLMAQEEAA